MLDGRTITAMILAWLIPGAGHLYLKKTKTGIVLLVAMGILIVAGFSTGYSSNQVDLGIVDWLYWFSRLANGVTFFLSPVVFGLMKSVKDVPNINFEYGRISLVIVGLLNYLAIINVFDVCQKSFLTRTRK